MNLLFELILGFWIIIPAYAANGLAPLAHGKRRIDFGRKFLGNDLLGAGKTWEGLIFGVFIGTFIGLIEIFFFPYLNPIALENGFALQKLFYLSVFFVPLGAMLGDLTGSFIKRRIGIKRGGPAPLLDQLDFVCGAFLFALIFLEVSPVSILLILIVTPFIHLLSSFIGHKIGVKKVPW